MALKSSATEIVDLDHQNIEYQAIDGQEYVSFELFWTSPRGKISELKVSLIVFHLLLL
jgi:hypothetical protein